MRDFRRLLLQIMLAALALGAAAGVLGVLSGGQDMLGRITATAFIAAVAAGLLLAASKLLDRSTDRNAGLLGMAVVMVEFFLAMLLTWLPHSRLGRWESSLALTIFFLFVTAGPGMIFLRLLIAPKTIWTGRTGIVFVGLTLAPLLMGAWTIDYSGGNYAHDLSDHFFSTGVILALWGLTNALTLVEFQKGDRRHWRWLGVACGVAAAGIALYGTWWNLHGDKLLLASLAAGAGVVALTSLSLFFKLLGGQIWVRWGTVAAAVVAAVFIVLLIVSEDRHLAASTEDWAGRLGGAGIILTASGTLAMCVLVRLNRRVDLESLPRELARITVVCPRCQKKQVLPVGQAVCGECELRIFTRIEEPRCPKCGYLLFQLKSNQCPECGQVLGGSQPEAEAALL